MVRQNISPKSPYSRALRNSGFSLVELLVVVGIIVAMAAVIIPAVSQFAGRGDTGAQVEEFDAIQSAMDNMIVDTGLITINPSPSNSKNDWTSFPSGPGVPALENYLRDTVSAHYYCWDSSGQITDQHATAGACP
ncbi:MAG: type II secretion system protein [Chloroflexi bacterium]|nr:type II secretion system protein [Chloroflexota bacterium]